ncbi:hypothetical protein OC845_002347 [Tilletia horrida]|nr:hypothetical protein OC845_002347 [Tilletia horrida]
MRALELHAVSTPPQSSTTTKPLLLGSNLSPYSSTSTPERITSPLSAVSIGSSLATNASNKSQAHFSTDSMQLRAKGSHYRAVAAAAEAAEAVAEAEAKVRNSSSSKNGNLKGKNVMLTSGTQCATEAAAHTPRIGSGALAAPPTRLPSLGSKKSNDLAFMDSVLAQLRLSVSPVLDAGSPTLAQLLPAFGDAGDDYEESGSIPPPPPTLSGISGLGVAAVCGHAGQPREAAHMQVTQSTQSDASEQTLVEPGLAPLITLGPGKVISSPTSSHSRSTAGHWSQPSDASTMTNSSCTTLSSMSSTRSLAQARQLRKELDAELRQMANDLAELQRRDRHANNLALQGDNNSLYGDLDDFDNDAFEFDDGRLEEPSPVVSRLSTKRRSSYRWSKADRKLVARCISTCLMISEDPSSSPNSDEADQSPAEGLPATSSCTRIWDGVPIAQESNNDPIMDSIAVDLDFFLESEEAEEDRLRPTYELPLGFLNQPLHHNSTSTDFPVTPDRATFFGHLHHSRSTPRLFSEPASASITPTNQHLGVETTTGPLTSFEIMAVSPIQLPARPSTASSSSRMANLGLSKSRSGLFRLGGMAGTSSTERSSPPPSPRKTLGQGLRSMASSNMLRPAVSAGQSERDTLARGPMNATPHTPSSPFKSSSLIAAFQRASPRSRPLPPLPPSGAGFDSPPHNAYTHGQGIAHDPFGASSLNKRLPVTPAGVGVGMARTNALERLQGALRRRIMAASASVR